MAPPNGNASGTTSPNTAARSSRSSDRWALAEALARREREAEDQLLAAWERLGYVPVDEMARYVRLMRGEVQHSRALFRRVCDYNARIERQLVLLGVFLILVFIAFIVTLTALLVARGGGGRL